MTASTTIHQIRFGYGLGPNVQALEPDAVLNRLAGPDLAVAQHRGMSFKKGLMLAREFSASARDRRDQKSGAQERYKALQKEIREASYDTLRVSFARVVESNDPLRERLMWFWADHFTAVAKRAPLRPLAGPYLDEAIRPNITGKFSDLLKAAVTHPFMLNYLDQTASIGPNSKVGKRRNKGLNENLAREVLELHTLGVQAAYSQVDVRGLAELMTGLSANVEKGFLFRSAIAEPGEIQVLGQLYGSDDPKLSDVFTAMDDLSIHVGTAQHIARKLAVHFVSDTPEPDLLFDLEKAFTATDGDLMALYDVLLKHPSAGSRKLSKAKLPFEFMASTTVALGYTGTEISRVSDNDLKKTFAGPMAAMGQAFLNPLGPDGWAERPEDWITPQGLATRISWAMAVADKAQDRIDDPRAFLDRTLGEMASPSLKFAVSAAQTRAEGIGMVLASADFNRR